MTKKELLKELESRERIWEERREKALAEGNHGYAEIYDCWKIECKAIREMIERDF